MSDYVGVPSSAYLTPEFVSETVPDTGDKCIVVLKPIEEEVHI